MRATPAPEDHMTDLAIREPSAEQPGVTAPARSGTRVRWWVPVLAFLAIGAVLWCVAALAATHLPRDAYFPRPEHVAGGSWFEGWQRWDAYWYRAIVRDGYEYDPGVQSSVAFFPAYPIVVWLASGLFPSIFVTGTVITVLCGLVAAVTFYRWCALRLSPAAAGAALLALLLYPYAWYLYGPIYADALCLAAALVGFYAVERDHLWVAGLAGFVASASRLVGLVVAVALVLRVIERRNTAIPADARPATGADYGRRSGWRAELERRFAPRAFTRHDAPVLLAFGGFGGWCAYLWIRFGDPFLFSTVQSAPGWDQSTGPATWVKARLIGEIFRDPSWHTAEKLLQAALAIAVLLAVPRVARRLGWAYAALALGAVLLPLVGTKDFMGTGRYLLAAFPVFAVVGELLSERPRLRLGVLTGSGLVLVVFTALFARGSYLS
ncbi:hypothetical protein [Rhabdothermincola sp.]|uniref:hypothetical protein n=1 Tax=Rhabdothermincola sp. TaxID=2820405 RepID=UPI002FE3D998